MTQLLPIILAYLKIKTGNTNPKVFINLKLQLKHELSKETKIRNKKIDSKFFFEFSDCWILCQDLPVGFIFVGGRLQPLIKIMLGKRTEMFL